MKNYIYIFIIVLIFISCKQEDKCGCFTSNGSIITETKYIENFKEIEIENNFDVYIQIDTFNKIEITSGKNILKGIKSEVLNNRLKIVNNNRCNWTRKFIGKPKLVIHCDSLSYFMLNGNSDITFIDTLKTNTIRFDNFADISKVNLNINCNELTFALHAGTGDMTVGGYAPKCYLWSLGNSYFHFENLITNDCNIMSNTTGQIYINTNNFIDATIKCSGNIYYKSYNSGIVIKQTRTGTGKIIKF